MSIQVPKDNITCPATGHTQKCKDLFQNCPKWIMVQGKHPQTGESVNAWDCADVWIPILMIENSQQQRQTAAAVESLRNLIHAEQNKLNSPTVRKIAKDL